MQKFTEGIFRGLKSIMLETDEMSATLLTEIGAKMVSLVNKKTGYEFLWQGTSEMHPKPEYASSYVEGDLSGMDDMFPTINECFYPSDPWRGIKMPDHGELWSIPWDFEIKENKLHMWTFGVRLPYRFEKWLYFIEQKTLRTDYKVTNLSSFEMDFIWAAHPLFNMEEGTNIEFPGCVKQIINTLDFNNRLGKVGSIHTWPVTTDKNGNKYDVGTILPKDTDVCEKFFALNKLSEGWVRLIYPRSNQQLRLEFPSDRVPYAGIWINQGGLKGQYNVALEPATGSLDDIYVSKMWQDQSRLDARGSYEWYLDIKSE